MKSKEMIERIDAALELIKEVDPTIAEKLNSLSHHVKAKYTGAVSAAIVACHYILPFLGV
jgi:hypothetical protein